MGELTVPSDGGYDPNVHLSLSDVAIDNPRVPSIVRKTEASRQTQGTPSQRNVHERGVARCKLCDGHLQAVWLKAGARVEGKERNG